MGAITSRFDASISSSVTMPTLNSTKIGNATRTSAQTNAGRTVGVGLEAGAGAVAARAHARTPSIGTLRTALECSLHRWLAVRRGLPVRPFPPGAAPRTRY